MCCNSVIWLSEVCYNESIVDSVVYNKFCLADMLQPAYESYNFYCIKTNMKRAYSFEMFSRILFRINENRDMSSEHFQLACTLLKFPSKFRVILIMANN